MLTFATRHLLILNSYVYIFAAGYFGKTTYFEVNMFVAPLHRVAFGKSIRYFVLTFGLISFTYVAYFTAQEHFRTIKSSFDRRQLIIN